jgi:xanthosine utilization system XapX-like protein
MSILLIFALVCGLVAVIAFLIYAVTQKSAEPLFAAVGFLGIVLLAADALFF